MSTPQHMFSWRNKKNINTFGLKKSALTSAMGRSTGHMFNSQLSHPPCPPTPPLLLIQEGQLSVTGKSTCMCTKDWLTAREIRKSISTFWFIWSYEYFH